MSELNENLDQTQTNKANSTKNTKPKKSKSSQLTGAFFLDTAAVSDNEEDDYSATDNNTYYDNAQSGSAEAGFQRHIAQTQLRQKEQRPLQPGFNEGEKEQDLEQVAAHIENRYRQGRGYFPQTTQSSTSEVAPNKSQSQTQMSVDRLNTSEFIVNDEVQLSNTQNFNNTQSTTIQARNNQNFNLFDRNEDYATQALLPSVHDPKLYKIDCQCGKEREIVLQIMELYRKRKNTPKQLFIKSAFTSGIGCGYIYIEAERDVHAREVAYSIRTLYQQKLSLVPIPEMRDTLTVVDQDPEVKTGQWVRMKRGRYRQDLAQVVNVRNDGTLVELKVIPRIDPKSFEFNERDNHGENNSQTHFITPKVFEQKFFDENEIRQQLELNNQPSDELDSILRPLPGHRGEYIFRGKRYRNGYHIFSTNIRYVETSVSPSIQEIERFSSKALLHIDKDLEENDLSEANKTDLNASLALAAQNKSTKFCTDDTVKVIKGDLINLTGRVVSVKGNKVVIMPNHPDLIETLALSPDELQKYFTVGSHIKVIHGPYRDETGLIVRVEEGEHVIVFFSDISSKEIRVLSQDVIETAEVSCGRDRLGKYQIHDFVHLGEGSVGVIVYIKNDFFEVLNQDGKIQKVRIKDINPCKLRNTFAYDKNRNQISSQQNDIVFVHEGKYKGQSGTVKYIFRSSLFLHSRTVSENSSIFVAKSSICTLVGARHNKTANNPVKWDDTSTYNQNFGSKQPVNVVESRRKQKRLGLPSKIQNSGNLKFYRDPWIGKHVRISKGIYKGYKGIVKSSADLTKFRIELHTENKIVTVDRSSVREENVVRKISQDEIKRRKRIYGTGMQTPLFGQPTPAYAGTGSNEDARKIGAGLETPYIGTQTDTPMQGNRTPAYGIRTPAYGARTPAYGARTPAYGARTPAYGARTPAYGAQTPAYVNKTPVYGGKTPQYGNKTPQYNFIKRSTPHHTSNAGNQTPGYDNEAVALGLRTPGHDAWNISADTPNIHRDDELTLTGTPYLSNTPVHHNKNVSSYTPVQNQQSNSGNITSTTSSSNPAIEMKS